MSTANLFTGLARSVPDGATLTLVSKGPKSSGRQLVSSAAQRGRGGAYISFPYQPFELAVVNLCNSREMSRLLGHGGKDERRELKILVRQAVREIWCLFFLTIPAKVSEEEYIKRGFDPEGIAWLRDYRYTSQMKLRVCKAQVHFCTNVTKTVFVAVHQPPRQVKEAATFTPDIPMCDVREPIAMSEKEFRLLYQWDQWPAPLTSW